MKQNNRADAPRKAPRFLLALPFLTVLAVLAVISFCIPLRPTVSSVEKRNLAPFPEFSLEAVASGSYFDDISLWFSDTFPGREGWLTLSSRITSLHGYSEISIQEDTSVEEMMFQQPAENPESENLPQPPAASSEETAPAEETTAPTEAAWGGVDAGADADITISSSSIIQIGDAAFNGLGFSSQQSSRYSASLTKFSETASQLGVRVVSAPPPLAIGILVEKEYLEKLNCAPQDETIAFLHDAMGENVIPVNTYDALISHNSEYLFFRTDHHWTALGAYYCYQAICEALEMEPAELSSFQEFDQGVFAGSLYGKTSHTNRLRKDDVMAYIPPGDISMMVYNNKPYGYEMPVIADTTNRNENEKYLTFISSDNPLSVITNESLPDAPNCILVKDSFGNCLAPFLTQNYHKVYVVDYRKFNACTLSYFIQNYPVQDVIFAPYLMATQSILGNNLIERLCS